MDDFNVEHEAAELEETVTAEAEGTEKPAEDETLSDKVEEILLNTREQCKTVSEQIRVKDELIARQNELITKLHSELTDYKEKVEDKFSDQLLKAVIKVRKSMQRELFGDGWGELDADELRKQYGYIFEDLSDLLQLQNVDAYQTDAGAKFDAAIHQAKTEPTDDPELDRKIKESIAEGYTRNGRLLVVERVVAYQYNNHS